MPDMPPNTPRRKYVKPPRPARQNYNKIHKKLRLELLAKYPVCQICNSAFATEADHLVYPAVSLESYQAVCNLCHVKKHSKSK